MAGRGAAARAAGAAGAVAVVVAGALAAAQAQGVVADLMVSFIIIFTISNCSLAALVWFAAATCHCNECASGKHGVCNQFKLNSL